MGPLEADAPMAQLGGRIQLRGCLLLCLMIVNSLGMEATNRERTPRPHLQYAKRLQASSSQLPTSMELMTTLQTVGLEGSHSFLEVSSVLKSTVKDYQRRLMDFLIWGVNRRLHWKTEEALDELLVIFFDEKFYKGEGVNYGTRLLAALKFALPRFSRLGAGCLPRTSRALHGWTKKCPPNQRLPLPWVCLMAIVGLLTFHGQWLHAVYLLVQFRTYIRPGVCGKLLVKQLIPPAASVGSQWRQWVFNLNPSESAIPGKTGLFDEAIVWDTEPWLERWFVRLVKDGPGDAPLWPFPHSQMVEVFQKATERLGMGFLRPVLYSLRHGGASEDLLARKRSTLEVKRRGGWSSDSSLKRYGKEGKLQGELRKVSEAIRQYGAEVGDKLEEIFSLLRPHPPPVLAALAR
ncbi:unnamed protein product [Polarella glacialis]|uniref:Uncharacterized protein n=1 Tax=Polarella glacialis TaxID=89957 RepID=A0A813IUC9_POLGL|nr:unnamed protein product [Polarella glacialis]